ncbi:uncharacterized protein LOC116180058 [Photinus pyralis]|uniref:uncharacterized protein LOC116180058 n=1 Tax=Photinus pyralis TaxID=7054 RepID=UPI0012674D63|nr:uncharacterized protein LOC116180058 [Photinus pyralis]
MLATRKQLNEENIDAYIQALKLLSRECQFQSVDAETNRSDNIRDAFISGIQSNKIRQRLLENLTLTLDEAYNQALSLEMAEINSQQYNVIGLNAVQQLGGGVSQPEDQCEEHTVAASPSYKSSYKNKRKCFFCGSGRIHPRKECPAVNQSCQLCDKKGHFAIVCRSNKPNNAAVLERGENTSACIGIVAASPSSLKKATVIAYIQGVRAEALIDTGSSLSFIDESYFNLLRLKKKPSNQCISMASTSLTSQVAGETWVSAKVGQYDYQNLHLLIVKDLCADLIIGHDILKKHSSLELNFGGTKEPIKVCGVAAASVPAVPLFSNISSDCKPIAIKSRRYSEDDKKFIKEEIRKLLMEGIIEESTSPWRAQVLITKNATHKKRLVIDYSQTINRYTLLDAYPLPNMEELVSNISNYSIFSAIDLQSAYHQIPILSEERLYTVFEAHGNLYQFRRIPFGVTNGVSSFQGVLDWIIREEELEGTYVYLDDITICGKTLQEHDKNLEKFMAAASKYGLTINKEKNSRESTVSNRHLAPLNQEGERIPDMINIEQPETSDSDQSPVEQVGEPRSFLDSESERIEQPVTTDSD